MCRPARAGDGTTWRAEDWEWDGGALIAQPKRRSARLEQAARAKPARPCAAAARLASHLADGGGSEAVAGDAGIASACSDAEMMQRQQPPGTEGRGSRDSSGSSRPGSAGKGAGGGGKAAARPGKAGAAGRRPTCQADGCNRDLSTLTYYHQRNRWGRTGAAAGR